MHTIVCRPIIKITHYTLHIMYIAGINVMCHSCSYFQCVAFKPFMCETLKWFICDTKSVDHV